MTSRALFRPLFVTPEAAALTGDAAWLHAMLAAEAALSTAQADAGLIPAAAAATIRTRCDAAVFDPVPLGEAAVAAGNPAIPLVEALRLAVGAEAAAFVHFGATSQDIMDTAAMLVTARVFDSLADGLRRVADECARLADAHRTSLMPGRTLMQHAVPTTFGLLAAGWLNGIIDAGRRVAAIRRDRLAAQLGGAAGTLSALGAANVGLIDCYATALGLATPVLPWHTDRGRIVEIGGALAISALAVEKIAFDVVLLSQTEVAELAEGHEDGKGRSSAMPQKRNSVGAMAVRAAAIEARGRAASLTALPVNEHQRGAGPWQAEWDSLSYSLALSLSAVQRAAGLLDGLVVDEARMRTNLELSNGLIMAEAAAVRLGALIGPDAARLLVRHCALEAAATGSGFVDLLLAEPAIRDALSGAALREMLDPASYLGLNDAFIDRALGAHAEFASDPALSQ